MIDSTLSPTAVFLWIAGLLCGLPHPAAAQTCTITNINLSGLQCNQPGEVPGFQLFPTGSGTGSGYEVSTADGTIFETGPFAYDSPSFFNLSPTEANPPQLEIVLTDTDDPDCFTTVNVDNPCLASAANCQIDPGLVSFSCNFGDIVLFTLNPTAQNSTSNFYDITANQGSLTSSGGLYGDEIDFLFQPSGTPPGYH